MGTCNDSDHDMGEAYDPSTSSPDSMQLSKEPSANRQTTGSESWPRRFTNKFRDRAPSAPVAVAHGRVTRKTASYAHTGAGSSAFDTTPRRRSHDNPRDHSEPCEGCIKLSELDERLDEERSRLSNAYEELLKDKRAEIRAVVAENDGLKKEIVHLKSISEPVESDEKTQQLKVLTEECNQKDERIRALQSEIDDQKPQITSHIDHIEDLKRKLEKSHKEAEDLKYDTDTYNAQVQSMVEDHRAMKHAIESLRSELAARDNDVRELKQEISRFRAGNPAFAPDNQIVADYQYLLLQLKNWTLSNFRKLEPTNLDQVVSNFLSEPSTCDVITGCMKETAARKCLVINMLVMRDLVTNVFRPYLFGLGETEEVYLKDLEASLLEQSTKKEVQFWRSTTLRMVIASKSHKDKVGPSIDKVVSELEDFLERIFPPSDNSPISKHRTEVLRTIVTQAVDLALKLRVQRPLYRFSVPRSGGLFQKAFMESAEPSLDDDDDSGGTSILGNLRSGRAKAPQDKVRLTIFPLLLRLGNEDGDNYDTQIVIHKGMVLKA